MWKWVLVLVELNECNHEWWLPRFDSYTTCGGCKVSICRFCINCILGWLKAPIFLIKIFQKLRRKLRKGPTDGNGFPTEFCRSSYWKMAFSCHRPQAFPSVFCQKLAPTARIFRWNPVDGIQDSIGTLSWPALFRRLNYVGYSVEKSFFRRKKLLFRSEYPSEKLDFLVVYTLITGTIPNTLQKFTQKYIRVEFAGDLAIR